jgi:L-ascorbate metabolism protein UlaG (beta-lactamase superfamily)
MKLTYLGHSCFMVEVSGMQLLFDPFIRPNALASNIDVQSLKPDYILISHGHWDHLADALEIAQNSGALIISNFEICEWFAGQGYQNLQHMNTGGKKAFEWGTVKITPALHSSGLPDKSYGGSAGGFIIESGEGSFYYSGDSALSMEMELVGRFHKLDFAVLPIGGNFTMDVTDAINCSEMIGCEKIVGVHYDTFVPIEINKKQAAEQFFNAGKELILLNVGESADITVSVRNPVY